ncbi:hypothetical protein RAH41_09085 [Gottfriedia acidiceleris]|uniref:hypothetical protein n=1 Tax=Gottfriedia acidiceleris TaxID=371036 RepID=UPI002F26242B
MFGFIILGFVLIIIAFVFFMEKKYGTGAPTKSDHQTFNEEIGKNTTNPTNSNNINGPN